MSQVNHQHARLQLLELCVRYAGASTDALDQLSLELAPGEIVCLLGPSGCGKSTALRAIAGFEAIRSGQIFYNGQALLAPPERRGIGLMFQDYALFPHLTLAQNIGFGLAHMQAAQREARIAEMLTLVGLQGMQAQFPHQLSGGQQQRAALARALAPAPALMLLDEPFSNLDSETRSKLTYESRALFKVAGCTVLMVTHDQQEAFAMADRVGVMANGKLLQIAAPAVLYHQPADRTVAELIGQGDWLSADMLGLDGARDVRLRPGQLVLAADGALLATVEARCFVGPHEMLRVRFANGQRASVPLSRDAIADLGSSCRLQLQVASQTLLQFDRKQ
jgi:iron(III) transport system ATP-binding protein